MNPSLKKVAEIQIKIYEKEPEEFSSQIQVSACYLEIDNKFLFLQCAANKLEVGRWGVPGGKLEKNETPLDGAVRELMEETGIYVDPLKQAQLLGSLYIRKSAIEFVYYLFAIQIDRFPQIRLSSEHQDYKWASLEELKKMPLMAGGGEILQYYSKMKGKKQCLK